MTRCAENLNPARRAHARCAPTEPLPGPFPDPIPIPKPAPIPDPSPGPSPSPLPRPPLEPPLPTPIPVPTPQYHRQGCARRPDAPRANSRMARSPDVGGCA
ncbi:MAG TPA: hypothetical protein VG963_22240, partial [Polyangiaceae bacterium]|nr:hypothetical protein [Polyangiaceae bacterium]